MGKINMSDILSGVGLSKINDNFQKIEDEFNNKVMYRDNPSGQPNTFETDVDMNGKLLYNLPTPTLPSQAARLQDVQNAIKGGGGTANSVNFSPAGGLASTNVQAAIQEVNSKIKDYVVYLDQFGAKGDNSFDNTTALAAAAAFLSTFSGTGILPKLVIREGIYKYSTSPNWGIQGLSIEAQGRVVFKHTGAGKAFIVDGGATGGGVYRLRVTGKLRVQGNALTTIAIYLRAVHHSLFEMEGRDAFTIFNTEWTVCNEYRITCTPVGDPSFSVVPTNGIVLDKRNTGETTSACIFYNTIMEGIISYGINLKNAVQNTFVGGTSESNGGGLFIETFSAYNNFIGLDCEFNSSVDIFCKGNYNVFNNILSDSTCTYQGVANSVLGGIYNTVLSQGTNNEFNRVHYSSNFGSFIDTGVGTIKRSVYQVSTSTMDSDVVPQKYTSVKIEGASPTTGYTLMGNGQTLIGGSASDLVHYHYGAGSTRFWHNASETFALGSGSLSFFGAPLQTKQFATPANATDLATAIALVNDLKVKLINYGLIS